MLPLADARLAILVDTAHLYHSAKSLYQARIDYRALIEKITQGRRLVRAIAFVVRGEDIDVTPFVDALHSVGFETRIKVLRRRLDEGPRGGSWNVGLALTAAELAPRVDAIAIASGDGDLIDVVGYLRAHGVRTEVVGFPGTVSGVLADYADVFLPLDPSTLLARTH